jgi:CheY-like chemotaxis protein
LGSVLCLLLVKGGVANMISTSQKKSISQTALLDADLASGASVNPIGRMENRVEKMIPTSLTTETPTMGLPSPRVLVVDDDHQYRSLIARVLESVGLQVGQACDGLKALEAYSKGRLEGSRYDLVLLDLGLPVMNGRECLQKLIEMDRGAKVMITSGSDPFDELPGEIRALASDFLQKPFSLKVLLDKVRKIIGCKLET